MVGVLDGEVLADTRRSLRVLETSHPPVYYIPAGDVRTARLTPSARRPSWCEFKGAARYYDAGSHAAVAWSYPSPSPGYEAIAGHYAFSPVSRIERLPNIVRMCPVRLRAGTCVWIL